MAGDEDVADRLADSPQAEASRGGRVAVVGAGWAGLACALELTAAGCPVTLFESARQAGGRARGVDWQGLGIDNGQHLLIGAYSETLRLLTRIGSVGDLRRLPLHLEIPGRFRLAARRLPAPLHVLAALLAARGLGWRDKWAAARMMHRLRSAAYRLADDRSLDRLLAEHGQGPRLVRLLWEPLCLAALNTPVEQASAQVFCTVLRDSLGGAAEQSDLLLPSGNLSDLFARPALAWLNDRGCVLRLGEKVAAIPSREQCFRLGGDEFDHVVCAVHPARAAALLPDDARLDTTRRRLAALTWQPICTLWLRYASSPALAFPMLGLADGPGQWLFDRSDLAPGLLSVVISAEGPHLGLGEEQLSAQVRRQIDAILPGLGAPSATLRIVEKRATFACTPNLPRPGNATGLPGLWLAGDYTAGPDPYPATLESAVRSGVECARMILAA